MRHQYWKPTDYEQIEQATNYDDLLTVALDVIKRTPKSIYQVCGPISTGGRGSVELNLEEFDEAVEYFSKQANVFDQMPFEDPIQELKETDKRDLLEIFYRPIIGSGHIDTLLFLPDWRSSQGANKEWEMGEEYGLKRVELPEIWREVPLKKLIQN